MTIEQTLEERGSRYGSFKEHARIAQDLQDVMRSQEGWRCLESDQKQALTVIADKIARMLNGDPAYRDNWHDIVGYAKLVDDRMAQDEERILRQNEPPPLPPKIDPFKHGIGYTGCLVCGQYTDHGGLPCPQMRAMANG